MILVSIIKNGILAIFSFVKKLFTSSTAGHENSIPVVYPRPSHNISRSQISDNALKVLYRLKNSGYQAYLVGGCVRDLLLGCEPKDFDVVTDARPEEVKDIFRNCRLIGRRFRLAHIHFGREIIEVATFRSSEHGDRVVKNGRLIRDNVYGSIEEDVWRRDFTVNALYYNIRDFSVIDYVGGIADHKAGVLRLIGNPEERLREDPVRMLRAVRFSVRLGFSIESSCEVLTKKMAPLLGEIPSARLYEEILKLFLFGFAAQTFEKLLQFGLFKVLFPELEQGFTKEREEFSSTLLGRALENTDERFAQGKPITPYFLFAAFLWKSLRGLIDVRIRNGENELVAYHGAVSEIVVRQLAKTAFPRRVSVQMRELWLLQPRFNKKMGSAPFRLSAHPRFRAAYDFLLLRIETGEVDPEIGEWWTTFQNASESKKKSMVSRVKARSKRRRRKSKVPVSLSQMD